VPIGPDGAALVFFEHSVVDEAEDGLEEEEGEDCDADYGVICADL